MAALLFPININLDFNSILLKWKIAKNRKITNSKTA